jgi:hypothetical protein
MVQRYAAWLGICLQTSPALCCISRDHASALCRIVNFWNLFITYDEKVHNIGLYITYDEQVHLLIKYDEKVHYIGRMIFYAEIVGY